MQTYLYNMLLFTLTTCKMRGPLKISHGWRATFPYFLNEMKIETSDGKRSFIMSLRIIVTMTHMVDKLEKDSHL